VNDLASHSIHSVLVTDQQALDACERFLFDHRVLVEPACGAALAVVYEGSALRPYSTVLVVVCGGATASLEQIRLWAQKTANTP
jgi:L-serine/L-threonine ammonia-lyase